MAKKAAAAPKKPESSAPNKQLVDAIITVKSLQDFIQQHGGVAQALSAVTSVQKLVDLTGGFTALTQSARHCRRRTGPARIVAPSRGRMALRTGPFTQTLGARRRRVCLCIPPCRTFALDKQWERQHSKGGFTRLLAGAAYG